MLDLHRGSSRHRRAIRPFLLLLLLPLLPLFQGHGLAAAASAPPATAGAGTWLLGLEPPADDGDGGAATGAAGTASGSRAGATAARLAAAEAALAAALGRPLTVRHRYLRAWPGLALDLSDAEAARLQATLPAPWASLQPGRDLPLAMDLSPQLVGAPAAWALATAPGGPGSRGEGIVVGIVDGGVDPGHASFAALAEDGYRHESPLGPRPFLGWCDPAHPRFGGPWACNGKLIGLYSWPEAGDDPRDDLGHGSHVAAIAAGNPLAEAWLPLPGGSGETRSISGIAPRAHLVSYDVCRGSACPTSAILAAIDQALADGVTVLNLSIALSRDDPWQDPVALALLAAREQGISVSVAAGNGGAAGSAAAPAPWLLTVGASDHGRDDPGRRDHLADFSARGPARMDRCCRRPGQPLRGMDLDLLKPELAAPGVAVLSAAPGPEAARAALLSGTSMAAPQAAGALALLRALHPGWTAAEAQSALLLSAAPVVPEAGQVTHLAAGAGRLDLGAAARAGLVLDAPAAELRAAGGDGGQALRAMNLPALVDGHCFPGCRFRRRLRAAAGGPLRWTATVEDQGPGAFRLATVTPDAFDLAPGEEIELLVEIELAAGQGPEAWAEGQLRLVPDDPRRPEAALPLLLRSRPARFPPAVALEIPGPEGRRLVPDAAAAPAAPPLLPTFGLTRGRAWTFALSADPTPLDPYDGAGGTWSVLLGAPGAPLERLVAEVTATDARDLDLYLGPDRDGDGLPSAAEQACAANLAVAIELCEALDPAPGPWWLLVQSWQGSGAAADAVSLRTGEVAAAGEGLGQARWDFPPAAPDPPAPGALSLAWQLPQLLAGDRWYGLLRPRTADGLALSPVPVDLYAPADPAPPTPSPTPPAVPSATATTLAGPTATAGDAPSPVPTTPSPPGPTAAAPSCVCAAAGRAPSALRDAALSDPGPVAGFNRPANPNLPPGPWNPPRRCLTLERADAAWHPLHNGLVYRAGCP